MSASDTKTPIYLRYIHADPVLFVLAFCFLVSEGSRIWHLDTLIVCIVAGFLVTNASNQGKKLIDMIEDSSLVIYVIFFCLAGATLNLPALASAWEVTLWLVAARMGILFLTTWCGLRAAGETVSSPYSLWMSFLPQAGVSLGLMAVLMREHIPWGADIRTIVVATIALNQLIGPITLKFALQQSGETGKAA